MVGNPKADTEEGNSSGDGISDTIVFFVSLYRLFFVPASDHNLIEYGVRGSMILYMSFRSFIPLLRLKVDHRFLIEKLFPFGSCQSVG